MKKAGCLVIAAVVVCLMAFAGCKKKETGSTGSSTPQTSESKCMETMDDAVKWYLQEIESNGYAIGTHFFSTYRILGTKEIAYYVTIYAHILCEWIFADGSPVSGGAGLRAVTFMKSDDAYEYQYRTFYGAPQIAGASGIPQQVKDLIADAAYFDEMREELEKEKADYLEAIQ